MAVRVRYGVPVGLALLPSVFTVVYGYQPLGPVRLWPWLVAVAPVVLFLAVETAGRVWQRAVWLGKTLGVVAVVAAGLWWWWIHSLLTWADTATNVRFGLPSLVVAVYAGGAAVSGRLTRTPVAYPQAVTEPRNDVMVRS